MGMYTEFLLKCNLKKNLPEDVVAVIKYLFAKGEMPEVLPDHRFFKYDNWYAVGRGTSRHTPVRCLEYTYRKQITGIFSRSEIKDYYSQIQEFLDWLSPYMNHTEGECIGWTWYCECNSPKLIHYKDSNLVYEG